MDLRMTLFLGIALLALIAFVRGLLIHKFASELKGDSESEAFKKFIQFARSNRFWGPLLIVLTALQYGIAVVFLMVLMWRVIH